MVCYPDAKFSETEYEHWKESVVVVAAAIAGQRRLSAAISKGRAEGEQTGRIKMAKSLKEQGVPAEVIATASGLSIAEIEKL